MASREDVERAMNLMNKNRPEKTFRGIDNHDMGLFAVMKFLQQATEEVHSKDISQALQISSARMAILLKKLEARAFIKKTNSKTDARVVIVSLEEQGWQFIKSSEEKFYALTEKILDEIGIEEIERSFITLNKIKEIVHENMSNCEEGEHA